MAARTALLIGNGRFPAEPQLTALEGPANDVRLLTDVLGNPGIGGFDVRTFVDQDSHRVQHVLEETLGSARRDDHVLLYYSGHGKLDSRGYLSLAMVNTTLRALRSTSIHLPFLRTLLDDCRSDQVLLMLDCCFSGAAAKAFVRSTVDDQLAVARSAGLHILTSSTAIETSRERERDEGGIILGEFTRCVVEGLASGDADVGRDAAVTLSELREYLESRLRGQTPRYWGFEATGDFMLGQNPKARAAALPADLVAALHSPFAGIREGAVRDLEGFLSSADTDVRRLALAEIVRLSEDDSGRVSQLAKSIRQRHSPATQRAVPRPVVTEVRESPVRAIEPDPPAQSTVTSTVEPHFHVRAPDGSTRQVIAAAIGALVIIGLLTIVMRDRSTPDDALTPSEPTTAPAPTPPPQGESGTAAARDAPQAEAPAAGVHWREPLTQMEFRWVPQGCFDMGCVPGTPCAPSAGLVHTACIDGFWMAKHEVTVRQFAQFVQQTGFAGRGSNSYYCGSGMARPTHTPQSDDHPVVCVSRHEAARFAEWLTSTSGNGVRFRLPTEAEWEYACRAGGQPTLYAGGNTLDPVGWFKDNSGERLQPVGRKAPNALGLFDMSGNAGEVVLDTWDFSAYAKHGRDNPAVLSDPPRVAVSRGGNAAWPAGDLTCWERGSQGAAERSELDGFRLAMVMATSTAGRSRQ